MILFHLLNYKRQTVKVKFPESGNAEYFKLHIHDINLRKIKYHRSVFTEILLNLGHNFLLKKQYYLLFMELPFKPGATKTYRTSYFCVA